jgi:hypothetical protein
MSDDAPICCGYPMGKEYTLVAGGNRFMGYHCQICNRRVLADEKKEAGDVSGRTPDGAASVKEK